MTIVIIWILHMKVLRTHTSPWWLRFCFLLGDIYTLCKLLSQLSWKTLWTRHNHLIKNEKEDTLLVNNQFWVSFFKNTGRVWGKEGQRESLKSRRRKWSKLFFQRSWNKTSPLDMNNVLTFRVVSFKYTGHVTGNFY